MKHGSKVECWHAIVEFTLWTPIPHHKERYGKTAIKFNPSATMNYTQRWIVAELVIAQRMRDAGWEAWWVDAFGRSPDNWVGWTWKLRDRPLPSPLRERYDAITLEANEVCRKPSDKKQHRKGRPDVVAWRGGESPRFTDTVFIEYKGPRDRFSCQQIEWFRLGMKESSPDHFVIVNWRG